MNRPVKRYGLNKVITHSEKKNKRKVGRKRKSSSGSQRGTNLFLVGKQPLCSASWDASIRTCAHLRCDCTVIKNRGKKNPIKKNPSRNDRWSLGEGGGRGCEV